MTDPIGTHVKRELSRFGPALGLPEVVAVWPEAVGSGIANNAWPARIGRDGTLHVATSSSAWTFELTQLAGTILGRLGERLGESAPPALRFAPGPLPEPGPDPAASVKRTAPIPSPKTRAEAERLASAIAESALREAVSRAAAMSLAAADAEPSDRPV